MVCKYFPSYFWDISAPAIQKLTDIQCHNHIHRADSYRRKRLRHVPIFSLVRVKSIYDVVYGL